MKGKVQKSIVSFLLVLVMMTSVINVSFVPACAVQSDEVSLISAGNGSFNESTSFMPKKYYQQLGMNLGDAGSMDKKPEYNPLLGEEKEAKAGDTTLTYTGNVVYGWSNPQLVSVVMSAPYWNELYYGNDMAAAGEASFNLSTGYGSSSETETTTNVGITFAVDGEVSYSGNGIVFGGDLELSSSKISSTVAEKSKSVGLTLTCGADKDNVVVCAVPLAIYEYKMVNGNQVTYEYVQAPVGMVYSVTSLVNYNNVARNVNFETGTEYMLEISLQDIYHSYTPGDPDSYFQTTNDMPTSFNILDGRLVPTNSDAEISGEVYSSDTYVNIGTGQGNAGGTLTYSCEKSNSYVNGQGYSMSADVYGGIAFGVDAFGITAKGTLKLGVTSDTSVMTSVSEMNTQGIETSVTYVNLPSGTNPDYGYMASQLVWYPTQVEKSAVGCPTCIISSVVIPSSFPPYLPDDLHVSSVGHNSLTLSWTNAEKGTAQYERRPDTYNIIQVATFGNTTSYVTVKSVDANNESVVIDSLDENTTYKFALQAVKSDTESVVGPVVEMNTGFDGIPVITKQPQDAFVYLGETARFSVSAVPANEGGKLSYQWQKLSKDRYGTSFVDINGAKSSTLELSAADIDSLTYRCVVTETNGSKVVNTVSDCADVKYGFKVSNYDDLCYVAKKVNEGVSDYVYGDIVVTNDIVIPQGEQWLSPIGSGCSFKGTFDGNGYTISGLSSTTGGLFDVIENATIKNITLKGMNLSVAGENCAGLCRQAKGSSLISNCNVSGTMRVSGIFSEGADNEPYLASGICCENSGTIEKCINKIDISADVNKVAGICSVNSGVVKNCANQGLVKCYELDYEWGQERHKANAAGIVVNNKNAVENCYNTGTVTQERNNVEANKAAIVLYDTPAVNCYYLNTCGAGDSHSTSKTIEQFKSGEVTFLLNKTYTFPDFVWYQNIDNSKTPDDFPTLNFTRDNVVFKVDTEDKTYSNIPNGYLLGDADLDSKVTVMDATVIQMHCAKLSELTTTALVNADTTKDNIISVSDATKIQGFIAGIIEEL